ncbi:unnamed protein product [Calypogeia fissa]
MDSNGGTVDEELMPTTFQSSPGSSPSNPSGITGKLCNWVHATKLSDIPADIQVRAKYLILDGIACGLVASHLPWSETAATAIFSMEPTDGADCTIIGWGAKRLPPLSAALLNGTFIQGFELDDYHSAAPLHSNSILLPALFSAASSTVTPSHTCSGRDLLLSYIVGCEVGPRVGLALHGLDLLSRGWHSGAIQGPSAAAAAVSSFLKLSPNQIEDALGIACTQACGLMSAQFGSMVKRMQHGFAARNGLFAALMARGGYTGIHEVFETPYGGFLSCFGQGSDEGDPVPEEIVKDLGTRWELERIRVKLHASMALFHGTIDCIENLQKKYPDKMKVVDSITMIEVECAKVTFARAYENGEDEPLTTTAAQMSIQYAASVQLVDGVVLMAQFSEEKMHRPIIQVLMKKVHPRYNPEFDTAVWRTRVTMRFADGTEYVEDLNAPRGIDPPVTNEQIVQKWRMLVDGVLEEKRRGAIEKCVLGLENLNDISPLLELLAPTVPSPI